MTRKRWIGALGLMAWSLTGGVSAADDKPAPAEVKEQDKGHGKAAARPHARGEARVNINEASKADLMKLDGVSAGTAQKIIAYRTAHGPFKRAHDLTKVDGVGPDVLERNSGRISVK
jgi:competence ComEA-like helix-hairpin-helix protein